MAGSVLALSEFPESLINTQWDRNNRSDRSNQFFFVPMFCHSSFTYVSLI